MPEDRELPVQVQALLILHLHRHPRRVLRQCQRQRQHQFLHRLQHHDQLPHQRLHKSNMVKRKAGIKTHTTRIIHKQLTPDMRRNTLDKLPAADKSKTTITRWSFCFAIGGKNYSAHTNTGTPSSLITRFSLSPAANRIWF